VPEGDTVYALARRLDTALLDRVLTRGELRVPAHATADLAGRTVLAHVSRTRLARRGFVRMRCFPTV
jgi:hypothetical protein